MREIHDHKTSTANETLKILVTDEPGQGGANHRYDIRGFSATRNPSLEDDDLVLHCSILFQNGPIKEAGLNGVTQEALLAIVIDRLRSFQAGQYACSENAVALEHCECALEELKARTKARLSRGVEGTNVK